MTLQSEEDVTVWGGQEFCDNNTKVLKSVNKEVGELHLHFFSPFVKA